jgi:hypothetical protein
MQGDAIRHLQQAELSTVHVLLVLLLLLLLLLLLQPAEDWAASAFKWELEKTPTNISPADLYSSMKLTRSSRLTQPRNVVKPLGYCAHSSSPIPTGK